MKYYKVIFKFIAPEETIDDTSLIKEDVWDIVAALAGEAGFESFEQDEEELTGYVQTTLFDQGLLDQLLSTLPFDNLQVEYSLEDAEDKNWNAAWEEEGFEPIVIDSRCVIHDMHHPAPTDISLDITIDAQQAFGTGTHETTRMIVGCLLDLPIKGMRVLDCGCGTGILSIVAAKLGASEVLGYDIDEWSVRNTGHNAGINEVPEIKVLSGDVSVLETVTGSFDIVLANINRNILMHDLPIISKHMAEDATLIISGFYEEDKDLLLSTAASFGMHLVEQRTDNGWCMLRFS
ncbi:MAG: 50S ribosomal protein L11 methyltransferase [Prevotella sp.]|nr:50S ribosomal protein L11 methyltransferase [Prevotella sp.]